MTDDPQICVDRVLPRDLVVEAAERAIDEDELNVPIVRVWPGGGVAPPTPEELAAVTRKKWKNGRTVRIGFLDGDTSVQTKVEHYAHLWGEHANIKFTFGNEAEAEVRISFEERGSWSYIGTDALSIGKDEPTMNFGWLTTESEDEEYERVVVHEFGHALACIHEHQNPSTNIPWDKEAVYRYYMGPPNNWTREQVDNNLFRRYSTTITQFSDFDRESIMLYAIPNAFTVGDYEVGWNRRLSAQDKQFVSTLYPGRSKEFVELSPDGKAAEASIGAHGEEDLFQFTVDKGGKHSVETEGPTDVVVALLGPDDRRNVLAEDDDSGQGRNAKIEAVLGPGTYYLRVRHFRPTGTGTYRISVRAVK